MWHSGQEIEHFQVPRNPVIPLSSLKWSTSTHTHTDWSLSWLPSSLINFESFQASLFSQCQLFIVYCFVSAFICSVVCFWNSSVVLCVAVFSFSFLCGSSLYEYVGIYQPVYSGWFFGLLPKVVVLLLAVFICLLVNIFTRLYIYIYKGAFCQRHT